MSNIHLTCYLNKNRPELSHHTEMPTSILGPEKSSQLAASLRVDVSNGLACAASARLWERLLENHRVPYLLLRVADMRMALGSKVTALILYEELQAILQDPQLEHWIARSRSSIITEVEQHLHAYKGSKSLGFTASQCWRSTVKMDGAFPYCRLQRAEIDLLRHQWRDMGSPEVVMAKFINLSCLETNAIEETVQFNASATIALIHAGFYAQTGPVDDGSILSGIMRNHVDGLAILRDTHQAMNEVFTLLKMDPINLTVEKICYLHKTLMRSSQVLYIDVDYGRELSYQNVGMTRQVSHVNVIANLREQNMKIQFCPWDEVNSELDVFCQRFNELIAQPDMDPFAAAAWISHVFATIHPFEDGNGKLSRILASMPLIRKGLPPLCVPTLYIPAYSIRLNNVRANRDGDYQMLMQTLYRGTKASLDALQMIG